MQFYTRICGIKSEPWLAFLILICSLIGRGCNIIQYYIIEIAEHVKNYYCKGVITSAFIYFFFAFNCFIIVLEIVYLYIIYFYNSETDVGSADEVEILVATGHYPGWQRRLTPGKNKSDPARQRSFYCLHASGVNAPRSCWRTGISTRHLFIYYHACMHNMISLYIYIIFIYTRQLRNTHYTECDTS